MFKETKLYTVNEEKVNEFNTKKVVNIEKLDRTIFRTDYVRDHFSLFEYVSRLEEIYNSRLTIGKKLSQYLTIENASNLELEYASEKLRNHLFYYIGFMVTSLLKDLPKDERGFVFYNYGVYENEKIYAIYFELDTKFGLNLLEYEDSLKEVLKLSGDDLFIRKIDDIYELVLFKNGLSPVSVGDLLYNLDFTKLTSKGIDFPIILGKDEENNDVLVDFAKITNLMVLGDTGYGKSTFLNTFLVNLLYLYDESEISIILFDSKDKKINREFCRSPHFIGHHTDIRDYIAVLKELNKEIDLRKAVLKGTQMEDWNSLRNYLLDIKDLETLKVFPWLLLVIDEFYDTALKLSESSNSELASEFHELLERVVTEAETLGIKVIGVGSRTPDLSIPGYFSENADTKIIYQVKESIFNTLVDSTYVNPPKKVGEFVLQDNLNEIPILVKGATMGLFAEDKLDYLIRTLSMDLYNSADMSTLYHSQNFSTTYTKDAINEENEELKSEGNMFDVRLDLPIYNIARALREGSFEYEKI